MKRLLCSGVAMTMLAACGGTTQPVPRAAQPVAPVTVPAPAPVAPPAATLAEARAQLAAGHPQEYERSLQALALSADTQLARRARATLGLHQLEQKRWDEAIASLKAAAESYPEVAPFLRLRIASAEDARGDAGAAAAAASEVVALAPDTSAATVARLRLPAYFAAAKDVAATDAAFRLAISVPIDELTESEFVELANRLAKNERIDLATRLRLHLLNNYTSGRFTEQTYGKLTAMADSPIELLSLDESVALAQKIARADRYDQALDLLGRISRRFPDAQTADIYRTTRMRALFNSRNYTQLLTEYPAASLTDATSIAMRARAAWRASRPAELLSGLAQLEQQFPTSKEAAEAKVLRAKYYVTDEVDYSRSLADLQAGIDGGATGADGENLWNLGWTYTLAGRHDEALATFDRYVRSYPDGDYKTNSLFWSAKLLDKQGRTAERDAKARQVVAEYPFSYYAYRTKELWPSAAAGSLNVSTKSFPDLNAQLAQVSDARLTTIRELQSLALHRDASREAKLLSATYADNLGVAFLLADAYVQGGEPFKANGIVQRRFRDFVRHGGANIPQRFWEILFPLAYFDIMRTEAGKRGIDPYLIAAITRQESGFEPSTVSNAGAVGLMQIMPAEAASIGDAAGIPGMTRERLFDPRENIAIGVAEYAQKLRLMNNVQPLAVAAYNAGETAVNDWLRRTPLDDIDVFIESISYAETRLYVKTVTRNQNEYKRIYGQ